MLITSSTRDTNSRLLYFIVPPLLSCCTQFPSDTASLTAPCTAPCNSFQVSLINPLPVVNDRLSISLTRCPASQLSLMLNPPILGRSRLDNEVSFVVL